MNIVGIGTDIVSVARMQSIWERFPEAFARRILTLSELEALRKTRDPVAFLAKRYAAKEAVAKALGTGFRPQGVRLSEIGVGNDPLGRPFITCTGTALLEMQKLQVLDSHLSLADEREFAVAFVVLAGSQKSAPVEVTGAK